jgi:hypothetical protein
LQRKGLLPTVIIAGRQRIPAAAVAEYVKRNSFGFLRSSRTPSPRDARSECGTKFVPHPAVPAGRTRFSSIRGV